MSSDINTDGMVNTPKKRSKTRDKEEGRGQRNQRIDHELADCVVNMKNPIFGFPLMDFEKVELHQIPPDFLMNFNQEVLERELYSKKPIQGPDINGKSGLAFVSEKILSSKQ